MQVKEVCIRGNSYAYPVLLWLEPWGDCIELRPGDDVRIQCIGPDGYEIKVIEEGSNVSIYGWTQSRMSVTGADGVTIWESPVPAP